MWQCCYDMCIVRDIKHHISPNPLAFIIASMVGLVSGCFAFLLKRMIAFVSGWLTAGMHAGEANYLLLLIPVCGIVLTGVFCRYVLHRDISHGVRQLMQGLKNKVYRLPLVQTVSLMIASTLTLGFGGSAGSEGPIACTGAAIGSNMARMFHMSPRMMMIMVGCGAGAGIAGIFKAPIGGALFTLEVLRMGLSTFSVLVLCVATLISALTAYSLSGFTLDIAYNQSMPFDASLLPYVVLLGVCCGFYSLYYSYIMKRVEQWLHAVKKQWVKNLMAGAGLAVMIFWFPALYGEGYDVIGGVINGHDGGLIADGPFADVADSVWYMIAVAAGIMALKCFAASATTSGGGVSGDFAPTLFAGCVTGYVFAMLLNVLFGLHLSVAMFAYFGMAGVMAGAIRAPLMAIFLTCEMAGAYSMLLPLTIASALSFGVVRLFTADSFFSIRIDRHNGVLTRRR